MTPRREGDDPTGRVADAGLASERTYLAWQRTGLAFAGVGALLVHAAGGSRRPVAALPGVFGLAVGGVVLLLGFVRYGSADAAARGRGSVSLRTVPVLVAFAAAVLGVSGLVLVLG